MSLHLNGSVSKDFPLFHSNIIPIHISKEKHSRKPYKNKFIVTNEHPDFFILDGMKEEGYRNPYLNEVIKFDRNETYKTIDFSRRQLNLINFIKSNRNYSQNPQITRYIVNANTKEINKKREQKLKDKMRFKKRSNTQENNQNINQFSIRDKILNKLEKFIPKIDYKMSNTIDFSKPIKTEYETINESKKYIKDEKVRSLENIFKKNILNSQKSAYLKNLNDYKISEAQQRDLNMGLNYQRKPSLINNLIRGKYNIIDPPPYRGENWGNFLENYYTIENNKNQFRRMGGLFSEFIDKNNNVISINKRELREKLEKVRELRKALKNKKNLTIKNSSNFKNSFH